MELNDAMLLGDLGDLGEKNDDKLNFNESTNDDLVQVRHQVEMENLGGGGLDY